MSFFKDFKEDLLQAADELIAPVDAEEGKEEQEEVANNGVAVDDVIVDDEATAAIEGLDLDGVVEETDATDEEDIMGLDYTFESADVAKEEPVEEVKVVEEPVEMAAEPALEDTEVTAISKGVRLEGNLKSEGSVNLLGSLVGDIDCKGKLVVEGQIQGNATAAEVYASTARIEGDITSHGSIKVASGSVIIGNINATSAVIAGVVKGDIDVMGPVIIDATAVVLGNIKSRSVQLNNGAVLDGIVSQCYSGIDVNAVFEKRAAK